MIHAREWGPPGLLLTKLHPPVERDQSVVRHRLLERLQPRAGLKLTLVAAPAGYGKTMLLELNPGYVDVARARYEDLSRSGEVRASARQRAPRRSGFGRS